METGPLQLNNRLFILTTAVPEPPSPPALTFSASHSQTHSVGRVPLNTASREFLELVDAMVDWKPPWEGKIFQKKQ